MVEHETCGDRQPAVVSKALAFAIALGWIAVGIVAGGACRSAPTDSPDASFPAARPSEYPGSLVPTHAIKHEFMARQRVTAHFEGRERAFDAVLQVHDGELILLGLTPMGTKAFTIRQQGTELHYEAHVPIELPIPPEYILLDVHRAHFMNGPAPDRDGVHVRRRDGETVRETWRDGRLWRRQFRRIDGRPAGIIDVRFPAGVEPEGFARRVELTNGWFGYRLSIESASYERLS